MADPQSLDVGVRTVDSYQYSYGRSESSSDDHCVQLPDFEETFMQNDTSTQPLVTNSKFVRSNSEQSWDEIDEQTNGTSEDLCKEVRCIEIEESSTNQNSESCRSSPKENTEISELLMDGHGDKTGQEFIPKPLEEDRELRYMPPRIVPSPENPSPWPLASYTCSSQSIKLTKSRSCKASLVTSPSSPWFDEVGNNENTPSNGMEKEFTGRPECIRRKLFELNYGADAERLSRKGSRSSVGSATAIEAEAQKDETLTDETVPDLNACVIEMEEKAEEQKVMDSPVSSFPLFVVNRNITVKYKAYTLYAHAMARICESSFYLSCPFINYSRTASSSTLERVSILLPNEMHVFVCACAFK